MTKIEEVARVLEPQAWRALGIGDTLAYNNRRTSSLRKARAAIEAMREPTEEMVLVGRHCTHPSSVYIAMLDVALSEGEDRG